MPGSASNSCLISKLTIANANCANSQLGLAHNISLDPQEVRQRLATRFADQFDETANPTNISCVIFDPADAAKCGGSYAPIKERQDTFVNPITGSIEQTQVKYIRVDRDATIPEGVNLCTGKSDSFSPVVILDIKGTLTINSDLRLGSRSGAACQPETYSSISQIPQNIIFAHNVNISGNVTNIDAWLIVSGKLTTCHNFTIGGDKNSNSPSKCSQPLRLNGPVITDTIELSRTGGAGTGHDSINAAEVFNLRADAYLWLYAQSQRYTQATTVFMRELAPRF